MQLLDKIVISRPQSSDAVIELLQGNLMAIPAEHATDILIISAYPGSYIPVPKTLMAALYDKGIDVETMAKNKAIDLRDQLGCWLSQPLSKAQQAQFNFKEILCFEPRLNNSEQQTLVGNIFRCINTFAFSENINVVAMPVLASGRQKVPIEVMLPAMLDAGIFWLESGLPLKSIKLVLFSDEQAKTALPVFTRAKQQNDLKRSVRNGTITGKEAWTIFEQKEKQQAPGEERMQIVASEIKELAQKDPAETSLPQRPAAPAPAMVEPPDRVSAIPPSPSPAVAQAAEESPVTEAPLPLAEANAPASTEYDYFVSYAHKHAAEVDAFVKGITALNGKLNIFYDKSSIPPGGLWIKQISDAIQKSKKVLIFLSPDYSNSMVCWDEFQCAKLVEYNSKKQIIQTIYLYNDAAMPPIMGIYSWADCREGDKDKRAKIAADLIGASPS